jgi:hypothetical protein
VESITCHGESSTEARHVRIAVLGVVTVREISTAPRALVIDTFVVVEICDITIINMIKHVVTQPFLADPIHRKIPIRTEEDCAFGVVYARCLDDFHAY